MLRIAAYAIAALSFALALTVRIEEHRVSSERHRAVTAVLAATNLSAERDSTRDIARANKATTKLLGDSLHLVERQALQVAQHRDALDAAIGKERRARYTLDATVDSLQRIVSTIAIRDSTHPAWQARFDLRQSPYTIAADVVFPEPPDSARIAMRVAIDPIHVDARVVCSSPNEVGVRTASVIASSPPWANLHFDRVEQAPELCASPALSNARQSRRFLQRSRLVVGGGRVIAANGSGGWGLFVGTGIQLWN